MDEIQFTYTQGTHKSTFPFHSCTEWIGKAILLFVDLDKA